MWEKSQGRSVMLSHSQTFAGLSFKSIWTDFEKNPSQNTIILIPLPTPEDFFFFLTLSIHVPNIFISTSARKERKRSRIYCTCSILIYNITRTKIYSVKFISGSKTIITFNYKLFTLHTGSISGKKCQTPSTSKRT